MDNRPRKNVRLSGPASKPVGLAERAGYIMVDAAHRIAEEKIGWTATILLTMATLIGGGAWMKTTVTDTFNAASSEFSAASVATPLTQDFSAASAHTAEPSARLNSGFTPPDKIPSSPAQTESTGVAKLSKLAERFADILPGHAAPQRYWTQGELVAKVEQHTENDPIAAHDLKRLIRNESRFDTKAVSKTGAKGLGQHLPKSQLGDMYTYKNLLPPSAALLAGGITQKIGKDGSITYGFTKGADQEAIWKAIEDPDISIILTREHFRADLVGIEKLLPQKLAADIDKLRSQGEQRNKHRIASVQQHLRRARNPAEGYLAYVAGREAATEMLRAYADPAKKGLPISNVVRRSTIDANPDIFYRPGKSYINAFGENVYKHGPMRTVEETYQRAVEIMGDRPLPRDLSRPKETRLTQVPDNPDFRPA